MKQRIETNSRRMYRQARERDWNIVYPDPTFLGTCVNPVFALFGFVLVQEGRRWKFIRWPQ